MQLDESGGFENSHKSPVKSIVVGVDPSPRMWQKLASIRL